MVTMTKYQIDPHSDIWDGIHQLAPDSVTLDSLVEEVLAQEVVANDDRECINNDHLEAAEGILAEAEYLDWPGQEAGDEHR